MQNEQIFGLVAQAMKKVGAIGKDSVNQQQKYKFRGIDAVYNALNPVMSELGLFVCPEIIDHRREERVNTNGTVLKYSILTIKYTMFAPDGSNISCVVVGEGMDSGDKASNKAMSVALKYAMFQLLMIPTEEMVDPDAETHEVTSQARKPAEPKAAQQETIKAKVETAAKIPADPVNPVLEYMANERESLRVQRGLSKAENNALWKAQIAALTDAKLIPAKPLADFTQKEAEQMVDAMYKNFTPTGTEVKTDDGKTA